ncbi:hypothetical protein [Kutzneria sp. 744]|uniref:hypothetical protein n=1 Tax=Kutzneria sp. (strain 744) TaxID=345341 RepID=UPI0012FCC8B3|nr:hypothetical protein [Kutzneria sp. 744]
MTSDRVPSGDGARMSKVHSDAQQAMRTQQALAARTVADHCLDADDRGTLLEMLGLDDDSAREDVSAALTVGLNAYLRAVARAVGVPANISKYRWRWLLVCRPAARRFERTCLRYTIGSC